MPDFLTSPSFDELARSLVGSLPILIMILTGILVLLADVILPREGRWQLAVLSFVGIGVSMMAHLALNSDASTSISELFHGALQNDRLSFLAQLIIMGVGVFVVLISWRYIDEKPIPQGEYYALLVFAVVGMMALAGSADLLALFLNLELLSIALYILIGIEKRNQRASEAAFKYFLLGSFAAAFMLLGIAFVFGATGELRMERIAAVIAADGVHNYSYLTLGMCLIIIGFGFKLSLAPFHMYAPDVYEGAPVPIAAALATGAKVAGLAAMFHVLSMLNAWEEKQSLWVAMYALVVASAVIGNVGAIVQPRIKRMLAYSSIAHSAYAMIPLVVLASDARFASQAGNAMAYYMLAYSVMTLITFGVVSSLGAAGEGTIAQYAGLAQRSPCMCIILTIGLLSLLGIPPTIGFFGKVYLFELAVESHHYFLAVLLIIGSIISAYYYLQLVFTMWMREPEALTLRRPTEVEGVNYFALGVGAAGVFVGVLPWLYRVVMRF